MSDRQIIRELAKKYHEIAMLDVQEEHRQLYYALHRKKPIRPVVLMDEIPWSQLEGAEELKLLCTGEKERRVETFLRRQMYKWNHFACDMIVEDCILWNRNIKIGSFGIDVEADILAFDGKNNIVSHQYTDQIPNEEALAKLHAPEITVNEEADRIDREWLEDMAGDILPIRMTGLEYVNYFEPWDNIAEWRGAEKLLWDLADDPDFMHAIVRKITDVRLEMLDKVEQMNLLEYRSPYIHCTPGLADELPGEIKDGKVTRKNIWGRGAAQIFAMVSPYMLEEFEIDYVKEFFKDFGLVYYGCCEPLDKRIDIIRQIPNLRKISITPWADVENGAAQIGSDFVMANKANPAYLATDSLDLDVIRKETRTTLNACRVNHTPVEIVLKDISSVSNHPEHLDNWAKTVMGMVLNQD